MIYNVQNDFIPIDVTAGTIQNNSYIYPVEISNQAVATLVAGMMNDTTPIDTGDGFSDYLNGLFNP